MTEVTGTETRAADLEVAEGETAPLRVAIVGCGIIGVNHARAIAGHAGLEVTALVDAVPEAARALADLVEQELGALRPTEHGSLDTALADGVDLVVVCTPSGLHVGLAQTALEHGAHVVIEKPLDVSMSRARVIARLAADAAERGLTVSVISQHRFDPASIAVRKAIDDGALGRITSAVASVAWWRSQNYYDSGQWRGTWELDGGGALMNQGVHTVDLLVWLLGTPGRIFAETARSAHERIEVEDVAVATIRFESGALAVLHATTAAYPGLSVRLQVYGSNGSAVIDDDQLAYLATGDAASDPEARAVTDRAADHVGADDLAGAPKPATYFTTGHLRQYEDVVDAIRSGRPPGVTVDAALTSLAVVRGVYASATLGRPVEFAEVLRGDHDDLEPMTGGAR